jgi:hypothetical protein
LNKKNENCDLKWRKKRRKVITIVMAFDVGCNGEPPPPPPPAPRPLMLFPFALEFSRKKSYDGDGDASLVMLWSS